MVVNPGMRVPQFGPGVSTRELQNAQVQVDLVARQDFALVQGARDGSLNSSEFARLSHQQNELADLSGLYTRDGRLSCSEQARLMILRSRFQADLARFRSSNSQVSSGGTAAEDMQSSIVFHQLKSLSPSQARDLRMNISAAEFRP